MRSPQLLSLCATSLLFLPACDSSSKAATNQDALDKIAAIRDCFPGLWEFVDGVFTIAETWQLDGDNNPADPAALSWQFTGQDITANLTVGSSTVTMVISAYGPNGAAEQRSCMTLSGAGPIQPVTSLSEAIDNIATELRNEFNTTNPFLHGVWSVSGGGISASGEGLLGIIGGATNANELEEVRTVEATVGTGAPPVDPSTITDTVAAPNCSLTFFIDSLFTDEEPGQEYPRGMISIVVDDGTAIANATITFDNTAIAIITVQGLTGTISLNLETGTVTL